MRLSRAQRDELDDLLSKAEHGVLGAADERRMRQMLDARNPGAAGLPMDLLVRCAGMELGAAFLLERLAQES